MPKKADLQKVLVIGSGPIIIGQGAEFDYAGTQACKALREEGIEVVLVNSNPATIMTDETIADKVYIQPLTLESLTYIIEQEQPQGLLPTLGGQTGLNLAMLLSQHGVLDELQVEVLGTSIESIQKAEDRAAFKQLMAEIRQPTPKSQVIHSLPEAKAFSQEVGFPLILRPAFTLGGSGGGVANNLNELEELVTKGLLYSPISQVLVEKSLLGWKEIEYEVIRDANDTCITICNMENMDPIGVHTGDSIVVAPSQTLRDEEYQLLRTAAIDIIRSLKIEGGCNVQFALNPNNLEYQIIEVNPRVSRSSALASKATGYPIAKVAAKIAVGLNLHEITIGATKAAFEPALDYVVTKFPKWPFDKFEQANRTLSTQMKATGEVMAIDRTFERSLLKAIISIEGRDIGLSHQALKALSPEELLAELEKKDDRRIFIIAESLRKGISVDTLQKMTQIDAWFLKKIQNIILMEERLQQEEMTPALLLEAESIGLIDADIERLSNQPAKTLNDMRETHDIYPIFKMVDSCAAEFESSTPYYYSTYGSQDESVPLEDESVLILGSGPIRIGQGIEFDYCSVHAAWASQEAGYKAIIINNNPETVSTDFDIADKLYFEPLFIDDVYHIIQKESPKGVMVQFGGQTAINLAPKLVEKGIPLLGTSLESIHVAEDRSEFSALLKAIGIPTPEGFSCDSPEAVYQAAQDLGFPLLIRPSYVIGGRAMQIIHNDEELVQYLQLNGPDIFQSSLWVDEYIPGQEVEVDAISDGQDILVPGIMAHIEKAGIHSGDSISIYPAQNLPSKTAQVIINYTAMIARALKISGLLNIQFIVRDDEVYVLEANPRASRTVPILSKVTGVPMIQLAIQCILGQPLASLDYGIGLYPASSLIAVKAPIFSFEKLDDVEVALAPEMKSTGEVLGIDSNYEKALLKAFIASGYQFPKDGTVFVSLARWDLDEALPVLQELVNLGYTLGATEGTAQFLEQHQLPVETWEKSGTAQLHERFRNDSISMILNTPTLGRDSSRFGFQLRALGYQYKIPTFTALETFQAYLTAMKLYHHPHTALTYDRMDCYRNQALLTI